MKRSVALTTSAQTTSPQTPVIERANRTRKHQKNKNGTEDVSEAASFFRRFLVFYRSFTLPYNHRRNKKKSALTTVRNTNNIRVGGKGVTLEKRPGHPASLRVE